jgi:hypothetical protein
MVISNIKAKLFVLKLRATSAEKNWLLFVNVIQKFRKAVQMCVPPCIQLGHGTQLSKSVLSRPNWYCPAKIGTSGIPRHFRIFEVIEEPISLKSLHGTTTGEDLFLSVCETMKELELPWKKWKILTCVIFQVAML